MDTRQTEIENIARLLARIGFCLEAEQPHISGERFLMAPNKLVLMGRGIRSRRRVIIKVSNLIKGKDEILQEKKIRDVLGAFAFSKKKILFPKEIYFGNKTGYLILITEFISQDQVFILQPLKKQIEIIFKTFKTFEGFKNLDKKKATNVKKALPVLRAKEYLKIFKKNQASIAKRYNSAGLVEIMETASKIIQENEELIGKFCGYLVHSDFVPHNFRYRDNTLYILDYSAFWFGNKYEQWARIINYMVIHSPALEKKLLALVRKRPVEEYQTLRIMRIYKVGQLLEFYTRSLSKTSSDLHALTTCRIEFWQEVLRSVIQDKYLDEKIRSTYITNRDNLRSEDEKKRQKEFAIS